jgi:hypothetical protein
MFLEDDFFHHSTPLVTNKGIKPLSKITKNDTLAAIDISNGISFVKPAIQETLHRGMYYDIETSIGNIKLGLNAELYYLHRKKEVAIKSHEIADTLIGSTIEIPSPPKSIAANLYPKDSRFIVFMALLSLPNSRVYDDYVKIKYHSRADISTAINVLQQLKIRYSNIPNSKDHSIYAYFDDFDISDCYIDAENVNLLGSIQSQLFRDVYHSLGYIPYNSKHKATMDNYIECHPDLTHLISVILIKAGYSCKHSILEIKNRMYNVIKHTISSDFDCEIKGAYLSQHEKMDRHIWLPDIYKGVIGVVNGRYILLPTQKML